ncbi:hypothetical protein IMSAGC009_01385 [Lachnospiraceae bacterium]|nr:hypothetical protein IMSAGC009_01385 [Lachnospiraceae bacterium]
MILTVEKYNFFEREAKNHLSNRFLEAFQPVTFNEIGFPTRIDKEEEVLRFFDTMHDGRLQWYYKDFDYAPTHEEFKIIKILAKNIYDLSKKRYGRGIIVKAPMLCSMNVCRRLNCLQRGGGKTCNF